MLRSLAIRLNEIGYCQSLSRGYKNTVRSTSQELRDCHDVALVNSRAFAAIYKIDLLGMLPETGLRLRILVFPDDEVTAFNCALALLLRHALVDLYRSVLDLETLECRKAKVQEADGGAMAV